VYDHVDDILIFGDMLEQVLKKKFTFIEGGKYRLIIKLYRRTSAEPVTLFEKVVEIEIKDKDGPKPKPVSRTKPALYLELDGASPRNILPDGKRHVLSLTNEGSGVMNWRITYPALYIKLLHRSIPLWNSTESANVSGKLKKGEKTAIEFEYITEIIKRPGISTDRYNIMVEALDSKGNVVERKLISVI
jgi:hypothetical protein